jgi:hypothetical protein
MVGDWVNTASSTSTAHHPDPHDPAPAKRGAIQDYGPMTYGRMSFAILADRQERPFVLFERGFRHLQCKARNGRRDCVAW